jgi:hypothetical protein
VPSTGIKNQPHRFEIVAISSVDEDILASCNVVVVVAGHREIDSSRTEKKHTTELGMLPLMNCAILSLCTTHFVFFLLRLGSSLENSFSFPALFNYLHVKR